MKIYGTNNNKNKSALFLITLFLIAIFIVYLNSNFGFDIKQNERLKNLERYHKDYRLLQGRSLEKPSNLKAVYNYISANLEDIPKIYIDIKFKHFQKLKKLRDKAVEDGILFRSEDDMVPAKIRYKGKTIKVKTRLKGDYTDHLLRKNWSLRFHIKGKKQFFGMRRFSIQAPFTKGYQYEALFLDHLHKEGILSPRYNFIDVVVNGDNWGIMAIEEHFSKELLEYNKRREGVILGFDENNFWKDRLRVEKGRKSQLLHSFNNWRHTEVKIHRENKVNKSEKLSKDADYAISLLRGLAFEKLKPSEVFDVELMAKYLAICELWGSIHELNWNNLKFYFNPLTRKLEPIGFDSDAFIITNPNRLIIEDIGIFFAEFILQDEKLKNVYKKYLQKYFNNNYLAKLKDFLEKKENIYKKKLDANFPRLSLLNFDTIRARKHLLNRLHLLDRTSKKPSGNGYNDITVNATYPKLVYAYFTGDSEPKLQIINPTYSEILVKKIFINGEGLDVFQIIPASYKNSTPSMIEIKLPKDYNKVDKITGIAKIIGLKQDEAFTAKPYPEILSKVQKKEENLQDILNKYPFIKWCNGYLVIESGEYNILEPVIIPQLLMLSDGKIIKNPKLIIESNNKINFSQNSYLEHYGSLIISGIKGKEVILSGINNESWKGIFLHGNKDVNSEIKYTKISDINIDDAEDKYYLTGAFTAYKNNILIENVEFKNIKAEDALNLIHSHYKINNISFENTSSDAIDSDFSIGKMQNLKFNNVIGDGVDISGTQLKLKNAKFNKISDKAISVGEKSYLETNDIDINNANIGIVSKDASNVRASNIKLNNISGTGFMAYVKKPEYGTASMEISDITKGKNIKNLAKVQKKSSLIMDGKKVQTQKLDIEKLYEATK